MDHATPNDGQYPSPRKDQVAFATLPNELLLSIIEYLPARDICRLRGQNQHMRKLIDTNEHFLVKDLIEHHQARINAEHKLLTDFSGCDIVDVLRRFYSHYGDVGPFRHAKQLVGAALWSSWDKWNDRTHGRLPTPYLLWYFSRLQGARNSRDRRRLLERISKLITAPVLTILPQSVLDALHAKLDSITPCDDCATYPDIPLIIHTTRARDLVHHDISTDLPWHYSSQNAVFHKLLGLPLLNADDSLAFCSHKFETVVLLATVASGPSTLLQQAGVLEDIYIY
jgi:hypothetical protein